MACNGDSLWVRFNGGAASSQQAQIVFASLDEGDTWSAEMSEGYFGSAYGPYARRRLEETDADPGSFQAVDASAAYFLGTCSACDPFPSGHFLATTDAGRSWTRKKMSMAGDLWFVDRDHGWVAGSVGFPDWRGVVLATFDGGQTWRRVLPR